ncbi:MAG: CPBP family intramembrane metalloprotease, partial [Phycisphaerae bacterium]|nr:CPBP family intramembrane metalloprotease [Phycisphaerae bacterium]
SWVESMLGGEPPRLGHTTLQAMQREGVSSAWWWASAAVVVVLAPLAEETIHRGFLQQALKGALRSRGLAIAGTSFMFALLHWGALPDGARVAGLTTLCLFSVMLGYLYERTGRLSMCVATHALFNAINLARL